MQSVFDEYGGTVVVLVSGAGLLGGLMYVLSTLINGGGDTFFNSVVMFLLSS